MVGSKLNRREAKRAEKDAYRTFVHAVLEEAHAAANRAFAEFAMTKDENRDACGIAYVVVYKPSYRLRTTLQELNEISPGYRRRWSISDFPKRPTFSWTAQTLACDAAREVLERHFAGEGQFNTVSRLD